MRTFECAGYGIPQLVEHREGIEAYFEPDKEIAVYGNTEEMIEKVTALRGDRDRADVMARAARERAVREHTYEHRVKAMLEGIM